MVHRIRLQFVAQLVTGRSFKRAYFSNTVGSSPVVLGFENSFQGIDVAVRRVYLFAFLVRCGASVSYSLPQSREVHLFIGAQVVGSNVHGKEQVSNQVENGVKPNQAVSTTVGTVFLIRLTDLWQE